MCKKAARVAVIYSQFPHYREAVFDALSVSEAYDFQFYYDEEGIDRTIRNGSVRPNHQGLAVQSFGRLFFQWGSIRLCWRDDFDAYIFLGNPFIVTTWIAAAIARLRRRSVLFWTHGWLRVESGPKGFVRRTFYRLAHRLLVYGTRARELGGTCGYPAERIHTVFNSLDYASQRLIRERLEDASAPSLPYYLCVGRLVESLELSLAFLAAKRLLARSEQPFELVVVGDGPLREQLEAEARALQVPARFMGALYDEKVLARLFNDCTAVVSPGKVGLLAMHALAYGARVITHGELDSQMPEVEAIEEGITGFFFRRGDPDDLSHKMQSTLCHPTTEAQRHAAIARIEADYNPIVQAKRIQQAVLSTLSDKS